MTVMPLTSAMALIIVIFRDVRGHLVDWVVDDVHYGLDDCDANVLNAS
jgi:hypothetical protein